MHGDKESARLDAVIRQIGPQTVAGHTKFVLDQDRVHPEDILDALRLRWGDDARDLAQCGCVTGGVGTSCRYERLHLFRLCQSYGGLHIRHSVVETEVLMPEMPLLGEGVIAQNPGQLGQLGVIGRDHAPFAGGDDLVGVEAKTAGVP